MNVLFISTEAVPFAKSGGLGDVIGSLPQELVKQGVEARVMLPLYKNTREKYQDQMEYMTNFFVPVSWRSQYCGMFKLEKDGVTYYFLDNEQYFDRDGLYGYFDDGERFAYYSRACLEALGHIEDFEEPILHCSEWQTAMVPVYLKTVYRDLEPYCRLRSVFTIHNIEYQGRYGMELLTDVLGIPSKDKGLLEYYKDINMMKGAIVACDKLTTVSPSYAWEIKFPFYGKGLSGIIEENSYKLCGILNGIDTALYNPAKDPALAVNFTWRTIKRRPANKADLQQVMELEVNDEIPVIAMVGRLVEHKGIDLVMAVFDDIMAMGVEMVVLGTGDRHYEDFFLGKMHQYPGRVKVITGFSPELASKIYGGSDMFLMPSVSEPCGLAQMIALRYGSVPIVRETGGLKDSVQPFIPKDFTGNGVTFSNVNAHDMLYSIGRALEIYGDKETWNQLILNGMKSDYTWKKSAKEYIELYKELLEG